MPESNNIARFFLCSDSAGSGVDAPVGGGTVLWRAAKRFADQIASSPNSGAVPLVVLPSARAARAFRAHFLKLRKTDDAELSRVVRTCTPGELPEQLLNVDFETVASPDLLPRLWATALEDVRKANAQIDADDSFSTLLGESAALPLAHLRDELSSVGVDCASLLETRRDEIPDSVAVQFSNIVPVELRYEELLRAAKLQDRWSARRQAWLERSWRYSEKHLTVPVWLIGCAELAPFTQDLLRDYSGQVVVGIAADESKSGAFNEYGVLTGQGEWEPGEFSLAVTQSLWTGGTAICDRIADTMSVSSDAGTTVGARTTVGVINRPDRFVVAELLADRAVVCRDGHGLPLSQTSPWILLDAIRGFYTSRQADELLELLVALKERTTIYEAAEQAINLDEFIAREVPLTALTESTPGSSIAKSLVDRVAQFASGGASPQEFLDGIFSIMNPPLNAEIDDAASECIEKFHAILPLMCELPGTTRLAGLAATLNCIARSTHEPRGEAPRVELLGWLELFLDESENLELLNPSADLIPGPPPRNPFLPEGLRRQLGMATQETRANRDRYRWWLITNSGRNVRVTIQDTGNRGEPLMLSPCLLPLENPQRAAKLLLGSTNAGSVKEGSINAGLAGAQIHSPSSRINFARHTRALPRLELAAPSAVSVSAIGDYLSCPYRFALKNIMKLKTVSDFPHEFDAFTFGTKLHNVLDSAVKAELEGNNFDDQAQLLAFMQNRLEREIAFPEARRGGTIIQRESLQVRLAAYAAWHLGFRQLGWRPLASEFSFQISLPTWLSVKGRIDRVERNTRTGEILLLDIKTSEKESSVDQFHRPSAGGGKWLSLQLPIYRMGWRLSRPASDSAQQLGLGLLFLDGAGSVSLQESKWSDDDLADAERTFSDATAAIASGAFWPPSPEVLFDPYPWLAGFTVFDGAP